MTTSDTLAAIDAGTEAARTVLARGPSHPGFGSKRTDAVVEAARTLGRISGDGADAHLFTAEAIVDNLVAWS